MILLFFSFYFLVGLWSVSHFKDCRITVEGCDGFENDFDEYDEEIEEIEEEEEEEEEEEGYPYPIGPMPQEVTNDLRSLDEMVRDMVSECQCPSQFPMIRVSEGKYKIGETRVLIFVRVS